MKSNRHLSKTLVVMLMIILLGCLCSCGNSNDDLTYNSVTMMDVSLEIPSTFEQGTDGDFYKEYLSDKNKDRTMLCYVEDDDYENAKQEAWESLVVVDQSQSKIKDIKQSEVEIDGITCHKIEYLEKGYSSVLILIPSDNGVVNISIYIEDDTTLAHVLESITIEH